MATVNFSVPDEVKSAFDEAFGDQNKSAVIAELMRRAVRELELQKRRKQLFNRLTTARARRRLPDNMRSPTLSCSILIT